MLDYAIGALGYTDPAYHYGEDRSTSLGRLAETSHFMVQHSFIQQQIFTAIEHNDTSMITFHMGMSDTGHVVHAQV